SIHQERLSILESMTDSSRVGRSECHGFARGEESGWERGWTGGRTCSARTDLASTSEIEAESDVQRETPPGIHRRLVRRAALQRETHHVLGIAQVVQRRIELVTQVDADGSDRRVVAQSAAGGVVDELVVVPHLVQLEARIGGPDTSHVAEQ